MVQKTKNIYYLALYKNFPGGSAVKNPPANAGDAGNPWVRSLGWEDPLEEEMAPHSSILAWRISVDRGVWRATVCGAWGRKKSDMTEQLHMHSCMQAINQKSSPTPGLENGSDSNLSGT